MAARFGFQGILLRILFAMVLVFATWNAFGWSYFHWLKGSISEPTPWLALAGIVLMIGWVIYVRATMRSLGSIGLVLAIALFGVMIWAIADLGLVNTDSVRTLATLIEVMFAGVLGIGMSWSHVRRRLSGQVDADDVDE